VGRGNGSKSKCSVTNAMFDCKVLSRVHATIAYRRRRVCVTDRHSSNGTFVNAKRIAPEKEVQVPVLPNTVFPILQTFVRFSRKYICVIFLQICETLILPNSFLNYNPIPWRDSISRPIATHAKTIPVDHAASGNAILNTPVLILANGNKYL
jgi:hypothetical protein